MMTRTKRKMRTRMPKFDVEVQLTGTDGNAFALMAKVTRGIRKAGGTHEDEVTFYNEATSGDYDHLLRTCMEWVDVA